MWPNLPPPFTGGDNPRLLDAETELPHGKPETPGPEVPQSMNRLHPCGGGASRVGGSAHKTAVTGIVFKDVQLQ